MGKKKSGITTKLSERFSVTVTLFKGKIYVHFNDHQKGKSITLPKDDFLKLLKKLDKIHKAIEICQSSSKKKAKKSKKVVVTSSSESSSDSDTLMKSDTE